MYLYFYMIPALCLLITFFFYFKQIIFIACSLKDSKNFFVQSLPLYLPLLFSLLLDDHNVDNEKLDGICSPTFIDDFPGLVLRPYFFMKDSRSTSQHYKNLYFHILFYVI